MQSVLNIPCLHGIDFPLLHRVFCLCRIWKLMLLTEKSAKALTEEVKVSSNNYIISYERKTERLFYQRPY